MRQKDGGWVIPLRTMKLPVTLRKALIMAPVPPDRSRPSSHLATGMVLRAFAADKRRFRSNDARIAGRLLMRRFFRRDFYVDRGDPEFWWRVSFPFWFTDIVSALDSLSMLGFTRRMPAIRDAQAKLRAPQLKDGSFGVKLLRTRDEELPRWIGYAVCRVFKRFYTD